MLATNATSKAEFSESLIPHRPDFLKRDSARQSGKDERPEGVREGAADRVWSG